MKLIFLVCMSQFVTRPLESCPYNDMTMVLKKFTHQVCSCCLLLPYVGNEELQLFVMSPSRTKDLGHTCTTSFRIADSFVQSGENCPQRVHFGFDVQYCKVQKKNKKNMNTCKRKKEGLQQILHVLYAKTEHRDEQIHQPANIGLAKTFKVLTTIKG